MLALEKRKRLDDCRAILGRLAAAAIAATTGDLNVSTLELKCEFATFLSHVAQQQSGETKNDKEEEEEEAFYLFATGSFADETSLVYSSREDRWLLTPDLGDLNETDFIHAASSNRFFHLSGSSLMLGDKQATITKFSNYIASFDATSVVIFYPTKLFSPHEMTGTVQVLDEKHKRCIANHDIQKVDNDYILKVLCDGTHFHVLTAELGNTSAGSCRVCSLELATGVWSSWLALESFTCLALSRDGVDNTLVVFKNVLFYVWEGTVASLHLLTAAHDVWPLPRPLWKVRADSHLMVVGQRLLVLSHVNSQTIRLEPCAQWEPMAPLLHGISACCSISSSHAAHLLDT